MDEREENATRRLIDGYAEERDEERRRVLFDFTRTALAAQDAKFSEGIRLGADLLAYTARRWPGVDDEGHGRDLTWSNAVQADLAALFIERSASFPQLLLALAQFQATVAIALREPGDGKGQPRPGGLDR